MKVLHVLYQSLPNVSGSSTRSSNILKSQQGGGLDVVAITSPGQQPVLEKNRLGSELIGGVRYYRTYIFSKLSIGKKISLVSRIKKIIAFPYFIFAVSRIVLKERPDVIHCHAMFYCFFASYAVAKLLKIPIVYEVRSLWYANSNSALSSRKAKMAELLENVCLSNADAVVFISKGLDAELSCRARKSLIVRNAVLLPELTPTVEKVNQYKRFLYVGSVIELEGLDYVVEAFASLNAKGYDVCFDVVGGGRELENLKQLAKEKNAPVVFHGVVEREAVNDFYSDADCVINYRRDELVAQKVTPLKPIEAMARGKLVLCSNVAGMLEIIGCDDNALVVEAESRDGLIAALERLIANSCDFNGIAERGYKFVKENRSWNKNSFLYQELYESLNAKRK